MIHRTPIKRGGPPRKKRPGTRRGQPTPEDVTAVREAVYARSGGRCELNRSAFCIKGVLPFEGDSTYSHGHLVHLRGKGAGGKTDEANCFWGCWHCHLVSLHNPKSVPPKVRP